MWEAALFEYVEKYQYQELKFLITQHEISMEFTNSMQFTPLYYVAMNLNTDLEKKAEMVKFLIENGGEFLNINSKSGLSPAVFIIGSHHDELIDYLITKLGDINTPLCREGYTALHYAAADGNKKTVLKLLQNGADPRVTNNNGNTPIHQAIISERGYSVLKLLVQYGGDINQKTQLGKTPLHMISDYESYSHAFECLTNILKCNPKLEEKNYSGDTPLLTLLLNQKFGCEIIQKLIDAGGNPNAKTGWYQNFLHYVAMKYDNFPPLIKKRIDILIENGISLDAVDSFGITPLQAAIISDNRELTNYLLWNYTDSRRFLKIFEVAGSRHCKVYNVGLQYKPVCSMISYAILHEVPYPYIGMRLIGGIFYDPYSPFRTECKDELQKLKKLRFILNNSISYYDLLKMNHGKLVKLMKNTEIIDNVSKNLSCQRIHIYETPLLEKIQKVHRCRKAQDNLLHFLHQLLGKHLPLTAIENVVSKMNFIGMIKFHRRILHSLGGNKKFLKKHGLELPKETDF